MKQQILYVFLFTCFVQNICSAQDSSFTIKVGIGVTCTNWIVPKKNAEYYANHGSNYTQDSSYKTDTYVSPSINVRLEIKLNKAAGSESQAAFFIGEKYNYCVREYTFNQSGWSLAPPTYATPVYGSLQTNHKFFIHQFTSSLGLQIHVKRFYFAPIKIDFTYASLSETITSISTSYGQNTEYKKKDELLYGIGSFIGFDFKIKDLNLFTEYQFDYHIVTLEDLEQFNNSLSFGIKF